MWNKILLIIILIFAFTIRIVSIDQYPPSLNWDEVSHGYNAYSLLETGSDEWGEPYPIIFRAYGDYKLPVYIYLTVPSVAMFGLTPLGVRLPSILAGTLLVLFTYLLAKLLSKDGKLSLIAAALVAIEPWSLFLSRIALEANVSIALIVAGIYFLLSGLKSKNNNVIIAALLLSASMWTYNTARIFTPMIVILFIIFYQREFWKFFNAKKFASIISAAIFAMFFLPMAVQLLSTEGSARYQNVSILNESAIGSIEYYRNSSNLPSIFNKLIYNRFTYFSYTFISNYISYFSVDYLFNSGGDNYQFNIQNHGLLYALNFPLIVIGIISGWMNKKWKKMTMILLGWALLAPIIPSITRDAPHTLRNIVTLPTPMLFSAMGIIFVLNLYRQNIKYVAVGIMLFFGFSFAQYVNAYTTEYTKNYSWVWQYGHEQVADYVMSEYENYDTILITKKYGEPHEFLLFYSKWDPQKYKKDPNLIRFTQSNWYWVDRFDKFYFINEWDIPNETSDLWALESEEIVDVSGDVLLVTSPGIYPQGWQLIESIYFLNGEKAFDIVKK